MAILSLPVIVSLPILSLPIIISLPSVNAGREEKNDSTNQYNNTQDLLQ